MAIKFRIQKARYKNAKWILCRLKIGRSRVAILIEAKPLKIPSITQIMIWVEFSEVVVRKSSENKTGPCNT